VGRDYLSLRLGDLWRDFMVCDLQWNEVWLMFGYRRVFMMRITALLVSVFIFQSPLVHASDPGPKKMPELTKEQRTKRADWMDKMAQMHKSMAECLRSDKPVAECHEQMRKECPMGKDDECPMMGGHGMKGMHPGMHHGGRGKGRQTNQKEVETDGEKD